MSSRREILLANIAAKLSAIIGDPSYSYGTTLNSVQRYVHEWQDDEQIVNLFGNPPTIIVRVLGEDSVGDDTVDTWLNTIDVDLHFVLFGNTANDADLNNALADMKRALFSGASWDAFGVNARLVSMTNRLVDPETGASSDGLHLNLNLKYSDTFGDPSQE